MNLFGQQIDGAMLFSVLSMLMLVVFWVFVLRRHKERDRWLNERLLQREREKRAALERISPPPRDDGAPLPPEPGKGPWG